MGTRPSPSAAVSFFFPPLFFFGAKSAHSTARVAGGRLRTRLFGGRGKAGRRRRGRRHAQGPTRQGEEEHAWSTRPRAGRRTARRRTWGHDRRAPRRPDGAWTRPRRTEGKRASPPCCAGHSRRLLGQPAGLLLLRVEEDIVACTLRVRLLLFFPSRLLLVCGGSAAAAKVHVAGPRWAAAASGVTVTAHLRAAQPAHKPLRLGTSPHAGRRRRHRPASE